MLQHWGFRTFGASPPCTKLKSWLECCFHGSCWPAGWESQGWKVAVNVGPVNKGPRTLPGWLSQGWVPAVSSEAVPDSPSLPAPAASLEGSPTSPSSRLPLWPALTCHHTQAGYPHFWAGAAAWIARPYQTSSRGLLVSARHILLGPVGLTSLDSAWWTANSPKPTNVGFGLLKGFLKGKGKVKYYFLPRERETNFQCCFHGPCKPFSLSFFSVFYFILFKEKLSSCFA